MYFRRINVPEWINFNQAISLVLFLGTVLCGLHLEFVKVRFPLLPSFRNILLSSFLILVLLIIKAMFHHWLIPFTIFILSLWCIYVTYFFTIISKQSMCSLLAFFLYYFGLGVFFWQFLKAAQVSGKFDEFFAEGRNVYLFYFLLGWSKLLFIDIWNWSCISDSKNYYAIQNIQISFGTILFFYTQLAVISSFSCQLYKIRNKPWYISLTV